MPRSRKYMPALAVVVLATVLLGFPNTGASDSSEEAPTGFDNLTNGLVDQQTHDADRGVFEEVDTQANGLGPVFNETSCAHCHSTPFSGGASQVAETRAGHTDRFGQFVNPTVTIDSGNSTISGRSLINTFAICPQAQEQVPSSETIRTLRMSVNTVGDGFIEAIDDSTLLDIARRQRALSGGAIHGEAIQVPVLEAPGQTRVGRFGWKDQQASLLSFAADAYLNEQGITSRLLPTDVTAVCDTIADPEDNKPDADGLTDIDHFARFMRAAKAPSVDATASATADAQAGSHLFDQVGCNTCHVRTIRTAETGTRINGGTFSVPEALGGKIIHPFSDLLLHDVGTGDGIVQNGGQRTANKLRTPPLWGLRLRAKLMHDGQSTAPLDAVLRHGGEASAVTSAVRGLTARQVRQLLAFLGSL